MADWIHHRQRDRLDTTLVCRGRAQAERLRSLLAPYGYEPACLDTFSENAHKTGRLAICTGRVSNGFVWPEMGIAVLTEEDVFGAGQRRRKSPPQKMTARAQLMALSDLKQDDLVVHQEHGIGRYEGLATLNLGNSTNDFLLITYRDGDKLYLPVDRMNIIQKYMGVESVQPVLDKLGGKSWEKNQGKGQTFHRKNGR